MTRTARIPGLRRALAALLVLGAAGAHAETLGDIEVRSAAGEPLDATIALGTAAGAPVGTECVFLSRGSPEDGPFVTRAQVAVYEDAGTRFIRLKSAEPVIARARLRVVVRCPGQPHVAYREYRGLFEPAPPRSTAKDTPGAAPVAAAPSLGTFPVRPGDTLESLAALLFPRQRATQRAYIEALRERNPSVAALGPRDPIPADAAIELPDLRSLPRTHAPEVAEGTAPPPVAPRPARVAEAPKEPRAPAVKAPAPEAAKPQAPRKAERSASAPKADAPVKPVASPKLASAPAPDAAARPPAKRAPESAEHFTLRLSGSEIDLTRSRGIDDSARAKLRERLLVLDNDDQVAALLALRDSMKRLEGRVAELQLKLSGMPANMPAARPEPAPVKVEPAPPKVELPPAKVEPAPPAQAEPAPQAQAAPLPAVPLPAAPRPQPAKKPASGDWGFVVSDTLWIFAGVLVLVALAFAWRLTRRRVPVLAEEALPEIPSTLPPPPTTTPHAEPQRAAEVDFDVNEPVAVAAPPPMHRREIASDAGLATDVPGGDPAVLRRRYIEQRFPDIANGTIDLANPDSVVKAARLYYEEGALTRAVELLQYATEENPAEQKPWLALFEIFRLERLQGQFSDLAQRFRDKHGEHPNWRKVQFFGREIDPGNALYRDLSVGIETIKFEAGKAPVDATFDPIAENWLNAPMDFENELLGVELRRALMAQAKLTDEDLAPNPMPALRSVEMFTVA